MLGRSAATLVCRRSALTANAHHGGRCSVGGLRLGRPARHRLGADFAGPQGPGPTRPERGEDPGPHPTASGRAGWKQPIAPEHPGPPLGSAPAGATRHDHDGLLSRPPATPSPPAGGPLASRPSPATAATTARSCARHLPGAASPAWSPLGSGRRAGPRPNRWSPWTSAGRRIAPAPVHPLRPAAPPPAPPLGPSPGRDGARHQPHGAAARLRRGGPLEPLRLSPRPSGRPRDPGPGGRRAPRWPPRTAAASVPRPLVDRPPGTPAPSPTSPASPPVPAREPSVDRAAPASVGTGTRTRAG